MTHPIMSKMPQWPRPHDYSGSIGFGIESSVVNQATIIPLISYDEGLGVINSYKSCPQNAGFAEYAGAKCYPTSRINRIFAEFTFAMTKSALETDKIHNVKFATTVIHTAFNEGAQAVDEKSTLDLNEIMELQVETVDRQTFGLYNTVDMKDGKLNALLDLEVGQEGLDTDLEIEGVAFSEDDYYDCLHYYTNGAKLRTIQTGLQWHTLTKDRPYKIIRVNQQSNTKYMNPYALLAFMVYCPSNNTVSQMGRSGDTTDVGHIQLDYKYRYNEHNYEFDHSLQ